MLYTFGALAAVAVGDASPIIPTELQSGAMFFALFLLSLALLAVFLQYRRNARQAQAVIELARYAEAVERGEKFDWRRTDVATIDSTALSLQRLDERLRFKREKLQELSELWRANALSGFPGPSRVLRAILDMVPVGVVVAQAPSGRIIEGNRAIEEIFRHPVFYSASENDYRKWRCFYANGVQVDSADYPLARALAGEEFPSLECRYQRGDGTFIWINALGAPIRDEKGTIIGAIVAVTDIDELKSAQEHKRLMNRELHHRVNNTLAMIQGIANITARNAKSFNSFRSDFTDRIQCLSRLSTLLVRQSWERANVRDVVASAINGEEDDRYRSRVTMTGEDVMLRSETALALGVALHELFNNAKRYGALLHADGRVAIDWAVTRGDKQSLALHWRELDGPPVSEPQPPGVGLYLLRNVLGRQIGGEINLDFDPGGLKADIVAEI